MIINNYLSCKLSLCIYLKSNALGLYQPKREINSRLQATLAPSYLVPKTFL
ncbi:hypothetical protein PPRY_a2012 [Pseudoalteromonas prydzensis ACAM 620]|nr:hypothetical protein [Pseudoalteromonas prydzensis ACAM 620]